MPDDLTKKGPADRTRINSGERWERTYWAQQFHVSEDELRAAVLAVGTNVDDVRRHLAQHAKR